MNYKILLTLFISATVVGKIFPPPVVEQYLTGELELSSVCNLFHFPSQHDLIQNGFYFDKILTRLNQNKECSKQLVYQQDLHVALTATYKHTLKPEAY